MTDPTRHLTVTRTAGVATIGLDRPPVNAVDLGVIGEFLGVVAELARQRPQPPLTWMFAPVTYPASSDSRKRAAATTSRTSPRCPAGMRCSKASRSGRG